MVSPWANTESTDAEKQRDSEMLPPPNHPWVEQTFTYEVPSELQSSIAVGQLVWVPFGARRLQGIVTSTSAVTTLAETRSIEGIVEPSRWLSPAQIDLARWIARRYLASLSECVWLMLPPGVEQKVETVFGLSADAADAADLTEKQRELVELFNGAKTLKSSQIPVRLRSAAESLVRLQVLNKQAHVRPPHAKPRYIKRVRLLADTSASRATVLAKDARRRNERVKERSLKVIDFLGRERGQAWVSAVYAATGATFTDLRRLEREGILHLETEQVLRDPLAGKQFAVQSPPRLTGEQSVALREIRNGLESASGCSYLLHGVTGSGKTEIYINAIEHVLAQGRQAIALVPEIALTPQTIQRYGMRFGSRIGVIHSDLSYGERFDTWRRAREGKLDVIIGPRSALFAPLPRLGLIVIDEEHEPSYKQEAEGSAWRMPLYHTREVALELARTNGASVIMGSATPDVETYYRSQGGEFKFLTLPQRILAHGTGPGQVQYQELPPVEVVDLRTELREGNRSIFSRSMTAAIREALSADEQIILFLNRRGSATCVLCRECGHALKCPRCDNPFTLHRSGTLVANELVCHHCGKKGKLPRLCPNCGSSRIRSLGLGTEKLEQLVHEAFPSAKTMRWDRDVTRAKGSHEAILDAFTRGEADVLIGTQMIAKGLDLPRVTFVGVVNADTGLNIPDFRASERTFQLLTQVAGRAGRSALGGKAIIQTYYPEHYAIAAAARHDYKGFFEKEMRFRHEAAYPPFRPLVRLLLTGAQEIQVRQASVRLASDLRDRIRRYGLSDVDLVGPAPAYFAKWGGKYRSHLLLRGNDSKTLLAAFPLPAGCRVDVDPINLL